ncbi:MAG: mechanosensitive ion channel [Gemmatimonadetes bacterium]|nr:mechanosensitive ion channel [Gemmatimonadota bacterium]MBI2614898.1 mechanosensitive ion channel [Gemmatimonadota bacterium]
MPWDLIQRLRPYLVDVLGAAALLLLGSIIGRFLASWSRRGAQAALDRIGRRGSGASAVGAARLGASVPALVGQFVYWLIFLAAVAAAFDILGLAVVSRVGERLSAFVPAALTGLAIVLVGLVAASLAGGVAAAGAASAGVRYAGAVGRAAQIVVLALALLLGLQQIGIHGEVIAGLLAAILAVALAGAALAFGLGARVAVSNIVAAYYVTQMYRVGQTVRVGEIEGRILRATSTALILDTKDGQVHVPAGLFSEQPSILVPEAR